MNICCESAPVRVLSVGLLVQFWLLLLLLLFCFCFCFFCYIRALLVDGGLCGLSLDNLLAFVFMWHTLREHYEKQLFEFYAYLVRQLPLSMNY